MRLAAHRNRKWLVLGFAFAATTINYLDRQTLSVMAPVLLEKFRISAEGYSRIIFLFMLAYTIMNGISGRLLDRLGSKLGYALTIAWWSGAEMLHSLTHGALSLGVYRFLLGIGEAGNYPAGVKLIAAWFPPKQRSLASGIFNSGASIGAILAPPLLAWTLLELGWRMAFLLVGLLGYIWLLAWMVVYRPPPSRAADTQTKILPLSTLLRSKFLWQFTLSKVFSDPVWYFYTFWFPQYLRVVHKFTMQQIGETAWIPFFTGAIGNICGGLVFTLLVRLRISAIKARRVAVLLFSAVMVPVVFTGSIPNPTGCIALISMATFGYCGALANLLAIPADAFPQEAVASVWGFASVGSGLGGMLFSLVTGWLVYHYSFAPVFMLFGLVPILAAFLVWALPYKGTPSLKV